MKGSKMNDFMNKKASDILKSTESIIKDTKRIEEIRKQFEKGL